MASVYQKKDSCVWYAQWSVFDSTANRWKNKQKSTGERDADLAQAKADEWQRAADAVASMFGARRRGMSAEAGRGMPRMSEREREILEAALANDPGRDPRRKAGIWPDFVEDTLARQEKAETREAYRLCLDRWAAHCEALGEPLCFVEDATIAMAESWRDALLEEGLRAKRVNFHLAAVSLVYERARKRGLCTVNPFADVQRVKPRPTADNLPAMPFDEAEIERLVLAPYKVAAESRHHGDTWQAGMAEEWEVIIRTAAVTGQRLMDVVGLTWGEIDLEREVIDYLPSKTEKHARRIAFPIGFWPAIVATLARWREVAAKTGEDDPVFPLVAARGRASRPWPSKAFIRIMEAAGILREVAREAEGKGRDRYTHGFHSLRHTANTRAAARGIPAEIRKELFGHSTVEMNRVYTHWQPEVLEEIMRGKG